MRRNWLFAFAVLLGVCAVRPTVLLGQDNSTRDSSTKESSAKKCPAKEPETYDGEPLCRSGRGVYPHRVYTPEPEYDEKARKKKIQGTVTLSMIVTKEGEPSDIKVITTLTPGLDQQAIKAVSRWRFDPAIQDGKPCPMKVAVEVQFKLY